MSETEALPKPEIASPARRRNAGKITKSWKDLSGKLQQQVLSNLDFHTLLNCRQVSRNLKCMVDKVAEDHKINPNLLWNPYFIASELKSDDINPNSTNSQFLGIVYLNGLAKLKQFIDQYSLSPKPIPHTSQSPAITTVEHVPKSSQKYDSNNIQNRAPARPLTPPPAASTPSTASSNLSTPTPKRSYRCHSCLQDQLLQSTPAKAGSSAHKPQQGVSKLKQSSSSVGDKTLPYMKSFNSPVRPRTAPSNFSNQSTTTTKPLISNLKPAIKSPASSSEHKAKPANKVTIVAPCATCSVRPPQTTQTTPRPPVPPPSILFPLGAVHISRSPQDSEEIVSITLKIAQLYGKHLTSFTLDDGMGEHSHLTFEQLSSILSHLPNLVFLGVTAGNYEHHVDIDDILNLEETVEQLPPLPHLQFVLLGYNSTYHLHMDILNAYGCQLKRFQCSKFGYFLRSPFGYHVSTNNSLQKLVEYANSIRDLYPSVLSSLEELKVPVISSEDLWRTVEQTTTAGIQWSSLKRLSLFYIHRGDGFNESCLADLWSFLNVFASTLEELYLDFQGCSDFVEWVTADLRPLAPSVYEPLPNVKILGLSALSLLRSEDMAALVATKFPALEVLTFLKWQQYLEEAIQNNNQFGRYYNGGPTPVNISGHMGYFWKGLPNLQQLSVRTSSYQDSCIYQRTRQEMKFVEKDQATYIF